MWVEKGLGRVSLKRLQPAAVVIWSSSQSPSACALSTSSVASRTPLLFGMCQWQSNPNLLQARTVRSSSACRYWRLTSRNLRSARALTACSFSCFSSARSRSKHHAPEPNSSTIPLARHQEADPTISRSFPPLDIVSTNSSTEVQRNSNTVASVPPEKTGRSLGHSIFLTFSLGKINGAILPTGRFTAEKAVWRVSRAQVVTAPAKPLDY